MSRIPPRPHPSDLLAAADQAAALAAELAALCAWLLPFAPGEAMAQLRFLHATCRSFARATATIQHLDRLLAAPNGALPPRQHDGAEVVNHQSLMAALIQWRLDHQDRDQESQGAARHRPRLRRLLARATSAGPSAAPPAASTAPSRPAAASAPLFQLTEEAVAEVGELAALVTWLLPFASAEELRELEEVSAITRSRHATLQTIHKLETLLSKPWHTPREHVRGDLSMIIVLIDYRIARGRGDQQRLAEIKEQILATRRFELVAAARRRRMQEAFDFDEDEA